MAAVKKRVYTPEEEALLVLYRQLGTTSSAGSSKPVKPQPPKAGATAALSQSEAARKLAAVRAQGGVGSDSHAASTFKRPTLTLKRPSAVDESAAKRKEQPSSYNPAAARQEMMRRGGGERREQRPMHTVFVGGINSPVTLYQLRDHFSGCGAIINVKLISGKNFGFVNFSEPESISEAMKLNGTTLEGNYLRVSKALPRKPLEPIPAPAPSSGNDDFFSGPAETSGTPAAATPTSASNEFD